MVLDCGDFETFRSQNLARPFDLRKIVVRDTDGLDLRALCQRNQIQRL